MSPPGKALCLELHQFRQRHAWTAGLHGSEQDYLGFLPADGLNPSGPEVAALMGEFVILYQQRLNRYLCQPGTFGSQVGETEIEELTLELLWMDYV